MRFSAIAAGLLAAWFLAASTLAADPEAYTSTVTGNVQMVGFRAMILRQAIAFNLAGHAKNLDNGTVEFVLQGDPKRIQNALDVIAKGTSKSSDVKVKSAKTEVDPKLATFTVIAWTSTTRMITHPYDLVFQVREKDDKVSEKEATKEYHKILLNTLQGDDLAKITDQGD